MIRKQVLAAAAIAALASTGALARDQIRIVGSSTVFPFSTAVAEAFGAMGAFPTPVVESTGTGGGFRLFCSGVGEDTPDVTNASRRITTTELQTCFDNGVAEVTEVMIGYDGIVVAQAAGHEPIHLSLRNLYEGLAARVPTSDDDCTMIDNPNQNWSDLSPELPAERIEVFGPPPTSGTRDAFVELAMEGGARQIPCLAEMRSEDRDAFEAAAHTLREDGAWIDSGENDNAIVSTLVRTPTALGVFGFSFLDQNAARVNGIDIDGVTPTFDAIATGEYPISRSLFFYVKRAHVGVIDGVQEFAEAFAAEEAWGPDGYLADRGLIPLPEELRFAVADAVYEGETLTMEALSEVHEAEATEEAEEAAAEEDGEADSDDASDEPGEDAGEETDEAPAEE